MSDPPPPASPEIWRGYGSMRDRCQVAVYTLHCGEAGHGPRHVVVPNLPIYHDWQEAIRE